MITNCDEDLFAGSAARLGVAFDWAITAEHAQDYKPSPAPFVLALEEIDVKAHALRPRGLHLTEDFRESARAFVEKRKPVYHGR